MLHLASGMLNLCYGIASRVGTEQHGLPEYGEFPLPRRGFRGAASEALHGAPRIFLEGAIASILLTDHASWHDWQFNGAGVIG